MPTQIQVAWARFPTPVVPEPPAVLAGPVRLAAQSLAGWVQQELLVPLVQELLEHLAGWVRSVPREQLVPPVLEELAVQLVRPVLRALQAR